jgi:hypothetical protein
MHQECCELAGGGGARDDGNEKKFPRRPLRMSFVDITREYVNLEYVQSVLTVTSYRIQD